MDTTPRRKRAKSGAYTGAPRPATPGGSIGAEESAREVRRHVKALQAGDRATMR